MSVEREGRQVVDVHVGVADERCECGSRDRWWRPGRDQDLRIRQYHVTRNNACARPADCTYSGNVTLTAAVHKSAQLSLVVKLHKYCDLEQPTVSLGGM